MSVRRLEVARDDVPQLDVLLVGPYPPPLGGISAHVKRLAAILISRGLRIGVVNHFGGRDEYPVVEALHRNPLFYFLAMRSWAASIVHYNHSSFSTLLVVAVAPRRSGAAYLVTIHGHELQPYLEGRVTVIARATRWALRRFDHIVAVSEEIAETLGRHVDSDRMTVIPAYLPVEETPHEGVSKDVERFLDGSSETLIVSAYRIAVQAHQEDMYGLDIAVETFVRLAHRHPDLRLGIFLAHPPRGRRASRFLELLLGRIHSEGLNDRAAVVVGQNLAPVFAREVIYLRPSRTDGDAVSIREALDAGVRVLASDVVLRPQGTEVLPFDDVDAWCQAVERQLELRRLGNGQDDGPPPRPGARSQPPAAALLELYARYLPADVASQLRKGHTTEGQAGARSDGGDVGHPTRGSTLPT